MTTSQKPTPTSLLSQTANLVRELGHSVETLDPILRKAYGAAECGDTKSTLATLVELREALSWLRWGLSESARHLDEDATGSR